MIAANFKKYPEAMALQLVLNFGHALIWALPRPTTRILRAIRAAAFKAAGRLAYPVAHTTPAWARTAAAVRKLGQMVRKAQIGLDFNAPKQIKGFAAHVAWVRETFDRCPIVITG